mgnify:CR=1 FL=1
MEQYANPTEMYAEDTGVFRGQGVGIFKAIISLTLFHEGRMFIARKFKERNEALGLLPPKTKK